MPIRIKPEQAVLGMYVQGFDGSWLSHPFWRSNFVIASNDELIRIRNCGTDLFIDANKGTALRLRDGAQAGNAATATNAVATTRAASSALPPPPLRRKRLSRRMVAPPAFGKADEARAEALAQRSTKVVKALFDDCRLGRSIQTPQILEVVRDIADTLERTGTAFASVTRRNRCSRRCA